MTSPMRAAGYRPEVDGLRALAVLSVVLYHIRSGWVPGGYVGVDIFFVISGFLITRNIWGELEAGKFCLADFYMRRVRRIAPAFLVVTAVTLIAGCFLLLPDDLARLARSAIWAALSAANIYYWKFLDTDYFAAATAEEPLLHLWSLGVEEQFYLIWPWLLLFLVLAKRPRAAALATTVVICVASFIAAEALNETSQKFAYYMLPTRAGELMLGALIALTAPAVDRVASRGGQSRWLAEGVSATGLGLIVLSLWGLDSTSPFPGVNALYPCLGAALLIVSGQLGSRLTFSLFARRPVVYVGLLSYSLYLWHWPILAFIRYFYGDVGNLHAVGAAVAMLVLSVASYHFVERRARHASTPPLRQVLQFLVAPVLAISLVSIAIVRQEGLRSMVESSPGFASSAIELQRLTAAASREVFPCSNPSDGLVSALRDPRCVLGAKDAESRVLLLGDSNAAHYIGTLRAVAESEGFAFRYITQNTCPAVFGPGDFGAEASRIRCTQYRETARRLLSRPGYPVVILAAQWAVHDKNPQLRGALLQTIREIKQSGRRVVLLGQVPGFPRYTRDCQKRWARLGTVRCDPQIASAPARQFPINRYMSDIADRDPAVAYADIDRVLCEEGTCSPYLDGLPVYFNPTHLSADGSYRIGRAMVASRESGNTWMQALSDIPAVALEVSGSDRPPVLEITVLGGGYMPDFPHKVRSQRHVVAGNRFQHVVIAEYLRIDHDEMINALEKGLSESGFSLDGPRPNQDAMRYLANRGSLSMTIDVHTRPSVKLVTPGAQGIVSFAWKDRKPR